MSSSLLTQPRRLLYFAGLPTAILAEAAARRSDRTIGMALLYHRVAGIQGHPGHEIVPAHGEEAFESQLEHLSRLYRFVRASQLRAAVAGRRRNERFPVAITFDDDHPSHVRTVLPALRRVGATATFFVTGASLDDPRRFWWELLQDLWTKESTALPLTLGLPEATTIHDVGEAIQAMSPGERAEAVTTLRTLAGSDPADAAMLEEHIRELVDADCEIGFHTLHHEPLTTLDDEALRNAMMEGRERLEGIVGQELTVIAYPHGKVDERVADAARKAGFTAGFTTVPRAVRRHDDPLLLGRVLPSFTSRGHFALQLVRRLTLPEAAEPRA